MVGLRKHNHHLPPRLYMKGRSYYYVTPANKWIALGPDLPAAKRKLLDLEHGPAVAGTVAEMIDRFLAEESPKRAARTHQDNVIAAKRLKAFFGGMSPNSVKPSYVAGFLDRHPAPIRANREVATLSSAYTYAMRKGFAEKNPCYGVRRNPEKPRGRYVEDGEFYAFLRFAEQKYEESERKHDGYLMLCVTAEIAYLTGQRREDVLAVPLRNVRDDGILFEQKRATARCACWWSGPTRCARPSPKRRHYPALSRASI
jgi:integrase